MVVREQEGMHPLMVISILHGSLLSAAPIWQARTSVEPPPVLVPYAICPFEHNVDHNYNNNKGKEEEMSGS